MKNYKMNSLRGSLGLLMIMSLAVCSCSKSENKMQNTENVIDTSIGASTIEDNKPQATESNLSTDIVDYYGLYSATRNEGLFAYYDQYSSEAHILSGTVEFELGKTHARFDASEFGSFDEDMVFTYETKWDNEEQHYGFVKKHYTFFSEDLKKVLEGDHVFFASDNGKYRILVTDTDLYLCLGGGGKEVKAIIRFSRSK